MRPETSPNSSLGTRPSEKSERGSGRQAGQKCTMHPECRRTSDWFMIACLHAFIGNTNHKLQVQLKEAKISGICQQESLEHSLALIGPTDSQKWVQTNNYKFHTFCSVHFHPSLSPRPSFRFFRGSGSQTTLHQYKSGYMNHLSVL